MKRILLFILLCLPVAVWAFVKPVRIVMPELAGVTCPTETLCIDDVARSDEATKLYDQALQYVDTSVGTVKDKPRIIFCSTEACSNSFGLGGRAGMTIGTFGIVLSPRGWTPYYVRHEVIHHLQSERLGTIAVWRDPQWLIEGMAYALSEDPRPVLVEPFEKYRTKFKSWYEQVGKDQLWQAARKVK